MSAMQIKAWVTGHMNPEVVDQMLNIVGEESDHALEAINEIMAVLTKRDAELASRLRELFAEKELFTISLTEPEPVTLVEADEPSVTGTAYDRVEAQGRYFDALPSGVGGTAFGEHDELVAWAMVGDRRYSFDPSTGTWSGEYMDCRGGTYEFRRCDRGKYLVMLDRDGTVFHAFNHYSQDENLVVANPETENEEA